MTLKAFFSKALKSLSDLAYPPLCLHCREAREEASPLFCKECLRLMELIDARERCPYCFSHDYVPGKHLCHDCNKHPPFLDRICAAFDYDGPAATLVKKMKYGNRPYLAEGAAAYMALQWLRLEWPKPDIIVPVPMSWMHFLDRGFNQSALIAEALSALIDVPVLQPIKRRSGDFSQAGLTRQQREAMARESIQLKERHGVRDKAILLVDDVMTTGSTLRLCAQALSEASPKSISGLIFCKAM